MTVEKIHKFFEGHKVVSWKRNYDVLGGKKDCGKKIPNFEYSFRDTVSEA